MIMWIRCSEEQSEDDHSNPQPLHNLVTGTLIQTMNLISIPLQPRVLPQTGAGRVARPSLGSLITVL